MNRWLAILFWRAGNKLARVGCWLRRSHIDPALFSRKGYCQQCGLRKDIWRLPTDRRYDTADTQTEGAKSERTSGTSARSITKTIT
jgi:hypothetical protein